MQELNFIGSIRILEMPKWDIAKNHLGTTGLNCHFSKKYGLKYKTTEIKILYEWKQDLKNKL